MQDENVGFKKPVSNTAKRGFASMDLEKQRKIASSGGKAAHANGTAHKWTSEAAREAGRKGGVNKRKNKEAAAVS